MSPGQGIRLEVVSTTVTLIPVVGVGVSGLRWSQFPVSRWFLPQSRSYQWSVSGYQVSAGLSSPSRGGFYHSHAHTGGRPGVGVSGLRWSQFPISRWFLPQSRSYRLSARCRGIRSPLVSVPRLEVVSTTVTLIPGVGPVSGYQVSAGLSSPSRGGFYHSHAHTGGRPGVGVSGLCWSQFPISRWFLPQSRSYRGSARCRGIRSQFPVSRWFLPQSRSYRGSARCRGIRSPLVSVPRLEVVSTTVTLIPGVGPVSGYQVSVPRLEVVSTTVTLIPGVGPVSGYQVSVPRLEVVSTTVTLIPVVGPVSGYQVSAGLSSPSRGGFYHSHAHTGGRPGVGVSGLRCSQFPVSRWFLPQSCSYRGSARCRGIRSLLVSVPRLEVVSTTVTLIPGVGPVSGYQVSAGLSSPSRGGFYHSHAHTGGRPGIRSQLVSVPRAEDRVDL